MTTLIISIILCAISVFLALYGYRRHIKATEKMDNANYTMRYAYRAWPRPNGKPYEYTIIEFDKDLVAVYSVFRTGDGHFCDVMVKAFVFDPTDSEDKEFAIREAEELIEKLREG